MSKIDPVGSNKTVSAIAVLDTAHEMIQENVLAEDWVLQLLPDYQLYIDHGYQFNAESRLPSTLLRNLWKKADEADVPQLGFTIGRKVNNSRKGILANWVSQAQTLGDAFEIFSKHISLLNPDEKWTIEINSDVVSLYFECSHHYPQIAIQRSMTALVAWGRELCSEDFSILTFEVMDENCSFPGWMGDWTNSLIKGSKANRITLNAELLNSKIPSGNIYLANIIKPRAYEVLGKINKDTYSCKVERLLEKNIKYFCDIDNVCDELNLSRSTLYRRLKEEGNQFSEILSKARYTKYMTLKRQGLKILAIAIELGFQDSSSLYKAAQNWPDEGNSKNLS